MPRSRRQTERPPASPEPPPAEACFEVRIDHDAPPGAVLGPLARLLLARARRQLQAERERRGNGQE